MKGHARATLENSQEVISARNQAQPRPEGFYWVRTTIEPFSLYIAHWSCGDWYRCGTEEAGLGVTDIVLGVVREPLP